MDTARQILQPAPHYRPRAVILGIGSSTGGVELLEALFAEFPQQCPATVVTQHLAPSYLHRFVSRLDATCKPEIFVAQHRMALRPGRIVFAPGDRHLKVTDLGTRPICKIDDGPPRHSHKPSVDVMMESLARLPSGRAVGAILTGLGRDGAEGLLQVRRAGNDTFGQDEASSTVYGMPKAAMMCGAVGHQVAADRMAQTLLKACR